MTVRRAAKMANADDDVMADGIARLAINAKHALGESGAGLMGR